MMSEVSIVLSGYYDRSLAGSHRAAVCAQDGDAPVGPRQCAGLFFVMRA